jgi:tetratricopeptide (TPR) repeat protein
MQAPPVPKIKAFLGDIKANYLDDEGAASDAQSTFQALLKMELLLRGVIVEDDNKLWQQVLSSAGKALMTENTIPKPLLSGANVMAGRVAEVCFNNRHLFRPNLSASSSALQRAKELKDQRFIILLQQDFDALEVAKGYFIRAAQSNPDKPPMFKKVWDIMVTQHSDDAPFEAQHAIENLIRIISSKGNAKRSTELRLKLIESYLNEDRENRNNSVSNLFADSDAAKPPTDVHALAELARDTLNECALNDLSDSDRIMYKILQLRVEMALESATIERTGQEQYQVDKNRSKAASIDAVRSKCQKQVFMQSEDPIQEVSFELRDVLLQLWSSSGSTDSTNDSHFLLCLGWVQKALLRLRDRAQVRGEDEAWIVVLQYIQELIDGVKKLCSWNLEMPRNNRIEKMLAWFNARPMQERELLSAVASIFPTAYWMSLKSEIEPMEEIFHLLLDVFSVLQQQDLEAEETQSDAVGSKSKTSAKRLQWKHARSIVMCFLCQDDPDIIFQITREAVARKGSDTKSPLGILQCLVSWSGWFQSPWPHCSNITHARRLLAAAKVDSGRPLSLLEEVLLDLAHADAELLQGGFANDAGNLYLKVQETVKEDSSLDEGTKALLLAHCNNGLARTCQVGITIPNQVSIEEYAQGVLHTLQKTHHISRLQVWHVPTALSASFTHQRSVARQLIADSLVGVGRCEEARVFLDAAVNDSPSDAPAAFSFGAFLLRMAFYVNKERSEEADKMAQVQLLKAAKLDPSKAKPFALLGFWFEEKGDLARAKGCYSKSLALDPCDPVAGRGILRLETYENSKQFLDVAIDGNSSLNGWAWQAIGLHKNFVEGEDDLAIVALLKALRCRDIMQIRNEPLGIFYQQQGENVNEEATVLEETGQCYRRLGRYTAAIRAFHAAIDAYHSDMTPPSSVLCSCAQGKLVKRICNAWQLRNL